MKRLKPIGAIRVRNNLLALLKATTQWCKTCHLGCSVLAAALCMPAIAAGETAQQRDQRMAWWREARFGMFIHFGLFSLPTEEPRRMDKYFSIPIEEFHAMKTGWDPVRFDADAWVRMAKSAGMRYVVLVTKSHDGWCLFDSKHTDFDVMATPYRRDILKPLAEACHREGLKICWYYSIIDWDHPDYLPRRPVDKPPTADATMDRYAAYMKDQLRELLTNYGPIGVLWFDGNWESSWTDERGKDLEQYLHGIQPDLIINNRVAKSCPHHISDGYPRGDFDTPEQMIPPTTLSRPDWETCMTMNDHWQYMDCDQNWKSPQTLIRMLIDIASKGGNLLLDIGPQPDGVFPQPGVERLEAIGRWMQVHGESIYGTSASPLAKPLAWGRCTFKRLADGKARLYLHVLDWPGNGKLDIGDVPWKATRAYLLADEKRAALTVGDSDGNVTIAVPPAAPDTVDSVVVLEVEQ
ncbi:MAG TPA: alpha-L-fucosidase [Verrucomicrobiae bacterium]|nr:alpha-L-fucosidase [Verrucomicrobiae bacterium]